MKNNSINTLNHKGLQYGPLGLVENNNPCVVCGEPIRFGLPGDEKRIDLAHNFCFMWGHSIKEHCYEHNTKRSECNTCRG